MKCPLVAGPARGCWQRGARPAGRGMCGEPRPVFCPFVFLVCVSVSLCLAVPLSPGPCRCLPAGLSEDTRSPLSACPEHLLFLSPSLQSGFLISAEP